MIVLEGPDKAGKSTLAQKISQRFGADVFHFGVPPADVAHRTEALAALQENPYAMVYDRFGLSAFAYDPFGNRPKVPTSLRDVEVLASELTARDALIIHVTASNEILARRLKEEGDANDYINERQLLYIAGVYTTLISHLRNYLNLEVITYDSGVWHPEAWIERCEKTLYTHLWRRR